MLRQGKLRDELHLLNFHWYFSSNLGILCEDYRDLWLSKANRYRHDGVLLVLMAYAKDSTSLFSRLPLSLMQVIIKMVKPCTIGISGTAHVLDLRLLL